MKTFSPTVRRIIMLVTGSAVAAVTIAAVVHTTSSRPVSAAPPSVEAPRTSPVRFTRDGELVQPTGYRKWPYVGTPLTPNDMNGGKAAFPEFHNVYINPDSFETFERTGAFPDGTVLVKELVSVGSKQASSGKGYFMGDFIGLEVSMKDKARFKEEAGNWAFFSFGHEYPLAATAKPQPAANCSACHGSLADEDFVFTRYYPVLRAVKDQVK